jgi:hypothetical protein
VEEEPTGTEETEEARGPAGVIPPLPPELSTKEQELRRLVEAGAGSPEELRALAAKLEEKRSYEQSLWRRDVRPALMQAKKGRISLGDLRGDADESRVGLGLAIVLIIGVLVLLFIATKTSFLWLLIAAVGVLVYAWAQGRAAAAAPTEPPASPPDATD